MRVLEVIALTAKDVQELNDTKVDRIEFCANMEADGLTPKKEVLEAALKITKKPINVMLRNKNSFILEEEESVALITYVKYLVELKKTYPLLNGIVLGYYTNNDKLDEKFLQAINKVSGELNLTFHKAVDNLIDNEEYLKLQKYNISTILTQGGLNKIENNLEKIKKLQQKLPKIEILLGGGIDDKNIEQLLKLNCSIHLGTLAKIEKNYNKGYNIVYLNKIKDIMIGEHEGLHT